MFRSPARTVWIAALAAVLVLAACSRRKWLPVIGEAYCAPISLNLRQDLAPRAAIVATVKHGERLQILTRRRRFVKVRTAADIEGWVDSRQLLSPQGMRRLKRNHAWAARQPSQGKATPMDVLNVHIDPNRYAPSFARISPDSDAEVIGRVVTTRGPYTPDSAQPPIPPPDSPNSIRDDWTHARLEDGRAGWVLSRMLIMNLPESVAMFSQGHRITSFHQLGLVKDRARRQVNNYLWTSSSVPPLAFNFDRFRVTVWNGRTRRFETGHIESNIRGFYPITVHTRPEEPVQRFTLIYASGKSPVLEHQFEMVDRKVKKTGSAPWNPPPKDADDADPLLEVEEETANTSAWDKVRGWVKSVTGH